MSVADAKSLTLYEARVYCSSEEELTGVSVLPAAEADKLSRAIKEEMGGEATGEASGGTTGGTAGETTGRPSSTAPIAPAKLPSPGEMLKQEMAAYENNFGRPMPEKIIAVVKQQIQQQFQPPKKISL
jgi:hypothetical protein